MLRFHKYSVFDAICVLRRWLIWAGLGFIVGGSISLAMIFGVQEKLDPLEDISSYSIGWILAGIVMIGAGFVLKPKK